MLSCNALASGFRRFLFSFTSGITIIFQLTAVVDARMAETLHCRLQILLVNVSCIPRLCRRHG